MKVAQIKTVSEKVDRNTEKLNTLANQLLDTYDEQIFIYEDENELDVYYE